MNPIRVLLVEDSVTQREILRRILEEEHDIQVVSEARNGMEGVAQARSHAPEVIVTDAWMPELDGAGMTLAILAERGVPIVVISEKFVKEGRNLAVECLAAGALVALEKPAGPAIAHLHAMGGNLRRTVRELSGIRIRRRLPAQSRKAGDDVALRALLNNGRPIEVVGIASSTGGPPALAELLGALPPDFEIPLLLVQHISAGFEVGFCAWLGEHIQLPIRLAQPRAPLHPGVTLARQGAHMILDYDGQIAFAPARDGEYHVPSADRLFDSLADVMGDRALGVVLTGMGSDGARGLARMREAGARTIAQSEETSLIWGMPGEAVRSGAAMGQASPRAIGELLIPAARPQCRAASRS
ncbi:MAG: chemotaxis protein CheB [Candidatus Hydrogenedentota bacterium]